MRVGKRVREEKESERVEKERVERSAVREECE